MLLLIDNYDSFTYNLVHFLGELGGESEVWRNDKITLDQIDALAPEAIVLSPGPATPDTAGICLSLIDRFAPTTPILGVCLGHQALGQAMGGEVIRAPHLMHGKTSKINHSGKGLFRGLNSGFEATRYHSLIVERETLPECLEISAETADGIIMGLRHRDLAVEGVQFHPEAILTEHGHELLKNFLSQSNDEVRMTNDEYAAALSA